MIVLFYFYYWRPDLLESNHVHPKGEERHGPMTEEEAENAYMMLLSPGHFRSSYSGLMELDVAMGNCLTS